MMVDEEIQSYRIRFELTKPSHSNPALLVYQEADHQLSLSTQVLFLSLWSTCT